MVTPGGGKITKHHKKADSPPPPPPVAQQILFGNPPPLLDLINRHSLCFPFGVFGFTFDRISIFANYDLLFLSKPFNWFNQSNDSDHVYFGRLGYGHFTFILDNSLWCTPLFAFLERGRGNKRAIANDENFLYTHFIE